MSLRPSMRRQALKDAQELVPRLGEAYRPWAGRALQRDHPRGEIRTVGYLPPDVVEALERRGHRPSTAVITVSDREIRHMGRSAKSGRELPEATVKRLPTALQSAAAVLWDREDPALVYVMASGESDREGKVVVRVNFATKGRTADDRRHSIQTNAVRTGGMVGRNDLTDRNRYELIRGEV